MAIESFTNSSLSCFRRCPREHDLRYGQRLKVAGEDREVLQVGQAWHKAHDASSQTVRRLGASSAPIEGAVAAGESAAYAAIANHAPGDAWNEKLRRLFAAYRWRWALHPMNIIHSEHTFSYTPTGGAERRGQIDGVVEIDGQIGLLERKTSSEDLDDGSNFWQRQRMGTQVSFYALAFRELTGRAPAFTLYDVVRKPTIRVKTIIKKDAARMRAECDAKGAAVYFGEEFDEEHVTAALYEGRETLSMYGARLTADIGDRPDFYFARKIIPRTTRDLDLAEIDTQATIFQIQGMEFFPRNPDACATFGLCDFFRLCSNGEHPNIGVIPDGFERREHLHPELEDSSE